CPIPTLHAVSAVGTRLFFYHLDTTNVPLANDTAPVERWDYDVLDVNGEARLHAVVDEMKEACENIANT
ncbi:hypothetical protein PISMIDRAFT_88474, partial [Pisolithus microcarpus 441]